MVLHKYNPSSRYRARRAQSVASFLRTVAVLLVAVLIGFWFGKQYAAQSNIKLKDELLGLTQERDLLRQTVTEVTAENQTINIRFEQLKKEIDQEFPEGPMRDLVSLLRGQLENGMKPERLSFAIRAARPPTGCKELQTKSFFVTTPEYKGENNTITIAGDLITIKGKGVSAYNDKNQSEAWYDSTKKVAITFEYNNKLETKKGVLPLQHSVVIDGREYRMTIESGAKSYAKVLFDSCAYP